MIAGTSVLAADAADDALVFRAVTRDAVALALAHPAAQAALGGPPLARGSLWATTLAAPHKSGMARATFDVAGPTGTRSEVSVLAARRPGGGGALGRWTRAGWAVLDVRAALPGAAAGPVRGISLMPPPPVGGAHKNRVGGP